MQLKCIKCIFIKYKLFNKFYFILSNNTKKYISNLNKLKHLSKTKYQALYFSAFK